MTRSKLGKNSKIILIGLLASVSLISACGNNSSNAISSNSTDKVASTGGTETASIQPANPLGKYDPPIVVKTVKGYDTGLKFVEGDSIESNIWTRTYEQDLGIKVKYDWSVKSAAGSWDQYFQKMNVTVASGSLPDIFMVNGGLLKQLADSGQLADLSEVYEQYASDLSKEILSGDGGLALKSATFDGKLVAIPRTDSSIDTAHLLWIRQDWLKKLNLSQPTTMDELIKVAEAFVTQDPDGNGKPDTYGLAVGKDLYGGLPGLEGFFNGYHAYSKMYVTDANGNITYGGIQPETKTALAKLSEMYKAGLIDREFGVKDSSKVSEDITSGKVGIFYGAMWVPLALGAGKELNPEFDLKPYEMVSIDDKPTLAQTLFPVSQYFVVRKGFEHPEAIFKLLNINMEKSFGETADVDTYSMKDGIELFQYNVVMASPPTKNLDSYRHLVEAAAANSDANLNNEEKSLYKSLGDYKAGDNKQWGYDTVFGAESSFSVFDKLDKEKNRFMNTSFYGATTEAIADNGSTLDKLELETFTKIIMGAANIDSFDKFVADWKKLGGDAILTELNQWKAEQQ